MKWVDGNSKTKKKKFLSGKLKRYSLIQTLGKNHSIVKINNHFEFQSDLKTFTKAIELNFVFVYISHYFFSLKNFCTQVWLPQDIYETKWQFKNQIKQFSFWSIKKIFMNPDFGKKSFHSKENYFTSAIINHSSILTSFD